MADPKLFRFETLSLHAGQRPDPTTGARAVPIYQTTSYVFRDVETAAALFNLERVGHIYSRISNPTVAVLEERVAALEGGVGAVATASGHAALHLAIATLMGAGSHIVASSALYGGSVNLFRHTLPRFAITTSFVPPRDIAGFKQAIRPETRLIFAETIGNPGLELLDLEAVAEIAHEAGIPLLIDFDFLDALSQPPLRAWRRSRPAFRDQMAGRPWRRHRRRAHRQWALRLGKIGGEVSDPDGALCRLSRHRLRRGVRSPGLHHPRPGRGACAISAPA